MALTSKTISNRLGSSAAAGFDLSNKLYRVTQVLPSVVPEYGVFADIIIYHAANLEQISKILPVLTINNGHKLLKDLDMLVKFTDEAYGEVKEALPNRAFDGCEVDVLLPFESVLLMDQVEALQVASTLIITLLKLGAVGIEDVIRPSNCLAETGIQALKKSIRTMRVSLPKEGRRRGIALKRAKTQAAIIEWMEKLLRGEDPSKEEPTEKNEEGEALKASGDTEKEKSEEGKSTKPETGVIKLDYFGADPREDGMPSHIRHHPDNVYAKIHKKDVDPRALDFYGLPWSNMKDNENYYIIWKPMEIWECDNLFQHTKKLRINEEHALIDAKTVISKLLNKWLDIESDETLLTPEEAPFDPDYEEFEKMLQELKAQDEKKRDFVQPMVRDRSWSPIPRDRVPLGPPRRRFPRRRDNVCLSAKTEHWRSWGEQQESSLLTSLKTYGWLPVYMRGTDEGQTWFYGPDTAHVRRFTEEYTPQDGPMEVQEGEEKEQKKEYLIISNEFVEEEALQRHAFTYQLLPSGHYVLDPRLTWGDIELLVSATSSFREERLYRKYRAAEKGDLHFPASLAIPDTDYLNGPPLAEQSAKGKAPAPQRWIPTKLERMPEEAPVPSHHQDVVTPSLESHDSFIEISK